jgi:ADP-ribosylglycohydrolase
MVVELTIMLGTIIGDICGCDHELISFETDKPSEMDYFGPNFTNITVLTCAVIDALLSKRNYKKAAYRWINKYRRYDPNFGPGRDLSDNPELYISRENDAAARVSPVGWAFDTIEETLAEAKRSAEFTHNHPKDIKGAQAIAAAVFLARNGESKDTIKKYIEDTFGYDLHRTLKDIQPQYACGKNCQGTVSEAVISFLESDDYTDAIQNAISLGGNSNTLACIAGGIAEAYYKQIPDKLIKRANKYLPAEMIELLKKFYAKETIEMEDFHFSEDEKDEVKFTYPDSHRYKNPHSTYKLSPEEIDDLLARINSGDTEPYLE